MEINNKLDRSFFLEDTTIVAKNLLGKTLIYIKDGSIISGRIMETEAYLYNDPACHASRGMTKRNAMMFGEPGHAYVYFTYGCHHCLNFVTQKKDVPEGVLIRALMPLDGIDVMIKNRSTNNIYNLCSGPGKLTQAFGIDISLNGMDLYSETFFVSDDGFEINNIIERPRIGINLAKDKLWRYYSTDYIKWVSKK